MQPSGVTGDKAGAHFARALGVIARTFPAHRPLYVCMLAFCGMTVAASVVWRFPLPFGTSLAFLATVALMLAAIIGIAALVQLVRFYRKKEPGSALGLIARWFAHLLMRGDRCGNVFHSLVTLTPLMITFSALKEQIPKIHPFAWDHTFMVWSRALGFGHLSWELLQPVLGHPPITAAINFAYDLWFVVMFGVLIWQGFSARADALRMQFLLAFAFAWFIGGNVLAVVFSSAGPCFYGHLFAQDPYHAQMLYLRAAARDWPVWSVAIQDTLWRSYATGDGGIAGISAMPSLHVVVAVLIALLGAGRDRRLGVVLWIYAGVIIVGSVHLAWHYEVDAIAGVGLALLFWRLAGRVVRAQAAMAAPPPAAAPGLVAASGRA